MTEQELMSLSITQLIELAEKTLHEYVAARVSPNNSLLAEQKHEYLNLLNRVIVNKRANEPPLK